MKSISFDRAASFYDETRKMPPDVSERVAASAVEILPPRTQALEIGIGTGRIAKPLMARGVQVTGADISTRMMQRMLATLPEELPVPWLAQADAAHLPFASGIFDAVLAVHVFHLIADWRHALEEIKRVLRPGGFLLTGYDWRPPDSPVAKTREKWNQIVFAHIQERQQPGVRDFDELRTALFASGARFDEWVAAQWPTHYNLAKDIESLENGIHSSSWRVPPEKLPQCIAELRRWALAEFGSLDGEFDIPCRFIWQRFQWN